jgi:hypothetical protein
MIWAAFRMISARSEYTASHAAVGNAAAVIAYFPEAD